MKRKNTGKNVANTNKISSFFTCQKMKFKIFLFFIVALSSVSALSDSACKIRDEKSGETYSLWGLRDEYVMTSF